MTRFITGGLRIVAFGVAAVMTPVLAGCTDAEDGTITAVTTSSPAPGRQNLPERAAPNAAFPPPATGIQPPAIDIPPLPTEVEVPAEPPPEYASPGAAHPAVCLALRSPTVTDAVASLPQYFDGAAWVAYEMGEKCASFTWVSATSVGATASTPDHHLFFADGVYLGTATAEPYSFSSVTGQTLDTVTVGYRWLVGDDPNANPSGGPALVRYQWNGSSVTMMDDLPPEVTG
ncbi:MAG: LppP/LprE family lipoprotein [Rhodococcus sp. (in: high G+C Gram-positive bacteria)]